MLQCIFFYDTVEAMPRAKQSTAITVTLPRALDHALQRLADDKHCGNKSSAIRHVLYKEAGVILPLNIREDGGADEIAAAERRSVKYGGKRKKK